MLQYKINYVMSQNKIEGSNTLEIASSVEQAVHSGALKPGARLPPIRDLAGKLRVSPVTVASAYRLLQARGLIVTGGRRGTHVRHHHAHGASTGRAAHAAPLDGVDLATGNPDAELLPAIGPHLNALAHVQHAYGQPLEFRPLIAFAAAEFEADGIPASDITITAGGLDAVERVLREHLRPGDRVVVEDPTLPALLDLIVSIGLTPQPCSLDDDGPEPAVLERVLGTTVRAIVVAPRAQNPLGAAISASRATDLARVLRRRPDVLLIEIDSAGPVSGAPMRSLIDPTRPHWAAIRSTSKFLGPDLRVAAMASDPITAGRVQRRQALGIRWVSHLSQALTLALWSDPSSGRRLARAAEVYRQRREALIDALASHEIGAHGKSGFNVWIPVREEAAAVSGLAARGWMVAAGERFRIRSAPAIRVTTSALEPAEARRLATDLAAVVRPLAQTSA
jgi:DNA-binding transcriptional MocR family regulator